MPHPPPRQTTVTQQGAIIIQAASVQVSQRICSEQSRWNSTHSSVTAVCIQIYEDRGGGGGLRGGA